MGSQEWFTVLVVLVGLERLAELVLTKRHVAWAMARGGVEHGQGHYPAMVVLHTALLVGSLLEVWLLGRAFVPALGWIALGVSVASQALRWWCITSLGQHWSTRVVVVPGAPLVTRGPYRFLKHPNYVAVVAEGVALPLVHTAWVTAAVFTVLNAVLLRTRVRVEDRALAGAAA
jgi:methyltransferase